MLGKLFNRNKKKSFVVPTLVKAKVMGEDSLHGSRGRLLTAVLHNPNESGEPILCVLFGAGEFGITNDQPSEGAVVTIQQSSHAEARAMSIAEPFTVKGMRYRTTTSKQMGVSIDYTQKDGAGNSRSYPIKPLNYFTAAQNQSLQADAAELSFFVDYKTSLRIPVLPKETVTIVMRIDDELAPRLATGTTTVVISNDNSEPSSLKLGLLQKIKNLFTRNK